MKQGQPQRQEKLSPEVSAALRAGISAVSQHQYDQALRIFNAVYSAGNITAPHALSYYGLCLARVEKKYSTAIRLCQKAVELEFYDSEHWVNLIQVYQLAGSRKKAVEVLDRAMRRLPRDEKLIATRAVMGFRSPPVLSFLHRDNPLNIRLGRMRHKRRIALTERRTPPRSMLLWLIPITILWISLVFWFLARMS